MNRILDYFRGNPEPVCYEILDMSEPARDNRLKDSIVNVAEQMVPSKVKYISTRSYPHLPRNRYHVCTVTQGEMIQRYTDKPEKDGFYFKIKAIYPNYDHTHDGYHSYDEIVMSVKLHRPKQIQEADTFNDESTVGVQLKRMDQTMEVDPYLAEIIDKVMTQAEEHLLAHKRRHQLLFPNQHV